MLHAVRGNTAYIKWKLVGTMYVTKVYNTAHLIGCYPKNFGYVFRPRSLQVHSSNLLRLFIGQPFTSLVSCLCGGACPATIVGRVISIWIDTVKRCAYRAFPHISQKNSKVQPVVTDDDASTAVVFVRPRIGVCAALNHRAPRLIGRGSKMAVFRGFLFGGFSQKAPA